MIDKYLWDESKNLYFDYDTAQEKRILYESVTAFWALWAGCASEDQCQRLVYVVSAFWCVVADSIGFPAPIRCRSSRSWVASCRGQRSQEARYHWTDRIDSGTTRTFLFFTWSTKSLELTCHLFSQIRMACVMTFSEMSTSLTISVNRPPHQIMIWVGLERYGYLEEAQRLAYRFLYMYVRLFDIDRLSNGAP